MTHITEEILHTRVLVRITLSLPLPYTSSQILNVNRRSAGVRIFKENRGSHPVKTLEVGSLGGRVIGRSKRGEETRKRRKEKGRRRVLVLLKENERVIGNGNPRMGHWRGETEILQIVT